MSNTISNLKLNDFDVQLSAMYFQTTIRESLKAGLVQTPSSKNIFPKTTTKKNKQSAVTKRCVQGYCKNALQKKINISKKYILQKTTAYKYTKAEVISEKLKVKVKSRK